MEDEEKEGQSRDSAVSSVISYLEGQTQGTPLPPFLPRFRAKSTGCTHRDKRCSPQSISGKAETTSTSVTRVRHQQHPGGRPARPAIRAPKWPIFVGHTVNLQHRVV